MRPNHRPRKKSAYDGCNGFARPPHPGSTPGQRPRRLRRHRVGGRTSASAVKRRVDRLVGDGVIQGFTIKVDPAVEDRGTEAWVELYCRGTVSPDELRALLDTVPEVIDAGTVTGSADAVVHMRSKDLSALEEALDKVRLAPQVDHTRSAIVLSKLVSRDTA
ncbi:Lrp/AsnC family transcriptional regulator [Sphingomonas sp. LR61]|uniref:Lrp/AsnC family transcriptional regulator n=1 Tax=Sphingomonas sp. LR61 TaxID=3050234 RepID=UPI002FE28797